MPAVREPPVRRNRFGIKATRIPYSSDFVRETISAASAQGSAMAGRDQDPKALELRELFAELHSAYARASEAVPPPMALGDEDAHSRFAEENRKIAALIRRIREVQGL